MVTRRRQLNILLVLISIAPLYLEIIDFFWNQSITAFLFNSLFALGIILVLFQTNLLDIDQWFLEKAITWLSVSLWAICLLENNHLLSIKMPQFIFQMGLLTLSGSLYFVERHFTVKNIILIIINMNTLSFVFPPLGSWLLLLISFVSLLIYLIRFAITRSIQFRLEILTTYIIVLLFAIVWVGYENVNFQLDNISWEIEAVLDLGLIPLAFLLNTQLQKIRLNWNLGLGIGAILLTSESSLLLDQPRLLNSVYLVLLLIAYINVINIFGGIVLKTDPKISVIIPTYNNQETIVGCLDSINKQSYQNWEVILIDDGSSDHTRQYVERYLKYNEMKIKQVYQSHQGRLRAIINGTSKIKGEIVYILNPEDSLYDRHVFYRAMHNLSQEKCDGSFVGIEKESVFGQTYKIKRPRPYYDSRTTLVKSGLNLGKDLFLPYIYWRSDIFKKIVVKNSLIDNLPTWYNPQAKLGLRMVNANFIGLKYKDRAKEDENNLLAFSGRLRFFQQIRTNFDIPKFSLQVVLYRWTNRLYISSMYPAIFKYGKSFKITPSLSLPVLNQYQGSSQYIELIKMFVKNYDPKKVGLISLPEDLKIYRGCDVEQFEENWKQDQLSSFYKELIQLLKSGTGIIEVKKEDKKSFEEILDFFTIKNYVQLKIGS
ncbi:glycosyltransferase family 2 protein [Lactobacillus sp. PV012]|nr:glycosyltransferase family 2 protein [Lactobacillus sp. PV012]